MTRPLMPKATAVWLVENTTLSFEQIARFCVMHLLEVQAIADGEVTKIMGLDPIAGGQLTREEITRCEQDEKADLVLVSRDEDLKFLKKKNAHRATMNRRGNRQSAVAWMLQNHAEVSEVQIVQLIHTTRQTIKTVREKLKQGDKTLVPQSPVDLKLCSEEDLKNTLGNAVKIVKVVKVKS